MGMTIDEAITRYKNNAEYERTHGNLQGCLEFRQLVEWLRKHQQLQADYENRLKADMVAMLTDLSMKIGEIEDGYVEFDEENKRSLTMIPLESVERLIDGEINSLKEA